MSAPVLEDCFLFKAFGDELPGGHALPMVLWTWHYQQAYGEPDMTTPLCSTCLAEWSRLVEKEPSTVSVTIQAV